MTVDPYLQLADQHCYYFDLPLTHHLSWAGVILLLTLSLIDQCPSVTVQPLHQ